MSWELDDHVGKSLWESMFTLPPHNQNTDKGRWTSTGDLSALPYNEASGISVFLDLDGFYPRKGKGLVNKVCGRGGPFGRHDRGVGKDND